MYNYKFIRNNLCLFLNFYVKELFRKPCFCTNEVYLEKSDVIRMDEVNRGNVRALNVNLGLEKIERNFLRSSFFLEKQR